MIWSVILWRTIFLVCGLIVYLGLTNLRPVRRLLLPMWLPLSVMIVAGFLLLATDQGRDLGVGLLGNDQFKLFLLALALFYWATGSWHAARLGLNRSFTTDRTKWPEGYEPWLRWLPRLLGAGAHLLAALSLALAAKHAIGPDMEPVLFVPVWVIGFVPLVVILVGVGLLWRDDQRYVATRSAFEADKANSDPNPQLRAAYEAAKERLFGTIRMLIAAGLATGVLLWWLDERLPRGLAAATCWVLASAACFLLIVSYRKAVGQWVLDRRFISDGLKERLLAAFKETDARHALSSTVLAGSLSFVAFLVAVWAWRSPIGLGEKAGSMVLGFFAFGAYIAVIDLVRILFRSGRAFAAVCVFLVLLAGVTSATRDFHRVRLCGDALAPCPGGAAAAGEADAETWVDHRPTVAEAAEAWYAQAKRGWPDDRPVPMLIVATAGGGIRAAYWTATILERLEHDLGPAVLRRHLFAISGVSGGSVGASAYVAAITREPASQAEPTEFLKRDFLAPAVAALAFVDGPSSVLPDMHQGDRGYALERAWEVASGELLARPFLSFFPNREALENGTSWHPALLLNATHQDTGRRVITSHLKIERRVFLDSFDAHALVEKDMPASTAGHNSARFSYVSPAGKLVPRQREEDGPQDFGFLLDGGYFENFGAVTALQLLREARRVLGTRKVRPIILQISSDPALTTRDRARMFQDAALCAVEPGGLSFLPGQNEASRWRERDGGDWLSSFFNELTAPIAGMLASRVAHGTLASQELAHAICALQDRPPEETPPAADGLLAAVKQEPALEAASSNRDTAARADARPQYAHLAMCDTPGATVPPLGWVLSPLVRDRFGAILNEQCGNPAELDRITQAFERGRAM